MAEYTPTTEEVRIAATSDCDWLEPDSFDRWLAAHDAEIRAEVERLRAQMSALSAHAGRLEQEHDEARRQVADLREGIEALPRHLDPSGDYVRGSDLRALLAGSGEDAPAVPDSADVEHRIVGVGQSVTHGIYVTCACTGDDTGYGDGTPIPAHTYVSDHLAVVGQGVTAERGPWEHPGHRPVQHRDRKPPWCPECGWTSPQPAVPAMQVRAAVRPTGQEQADG